MSRLPADTFERYVGLGPSRSYRALGKLLGVSKRAIAKRAKRENWSGRLARIDEESRRRSDQHLVETLSDMRTRHMRSLRAIHGRALEALKNFPLNSAAEAVTALDKAIRLELAIVGQPTDDGDPSVAAAAARESRRREIREDIRAMLESVPDAGSAFARQADCGSNSGG